MDENLIAEARTKLYSGVISDVLDGLGNMHHALAPKIRPLDDGLVMFGRARTALYMPVYHVEPGVNPYELEIGLDRQPGEGRRRRHGLPARGADRALGRAADHRGARPRSRRLRDGRARPRRPADPRDALPGILRRHRPARQQGPRRRDGGGRAGRMRRRADPSRAIGSSATWTAWSSSRPSSRGGRSSSRSRRCWRRIRCARSWRPARSLPSSSPGTGSCSYSAATFISNFCASTGAARRMSASSSGIPPSATRAATPTLWMMSSAS